MLRLFMLRPSGQRRRRASLGLCFRMETQSFAKGKETRVGPAKSSPNLPLALAAMLGLLAVALGAYGAHGLHKAAEYHLMWEKAVLYHLVHSVVLVAVAREFRRYWLSFIVFVLGIVLFSGSIYFYVLVGSPEVLRATPVGGTLFLLAWASLAVGALLPARREGPEAGS
jgi:uncharacterized membrane protein YgdD (TMEM256/DUF423 family)